jgi:tRNA-dihydrouridine synthase B
MARKHLGWYAKGFPGAAEFRGRVVRLTEPEEIRAAIKGAWAPALDTPEPADISDQKAAA